MIFQLSFVSLLTTQTKVQQWIVTCFINLFVISIFLEDAGKDTEIGMMTDKNDGNPSSLCLSECFYFHFVLVKVAKLGTYWA